MCVVCVCVVCVCVCVRTCVHEYVSVNATDHLRNGLLGVVLKHAQLALKLCVVVTDLNSSFRGQEQASVVFLVDGLDPPLRRRGGERKGWGRGGA